MESRFAHIVLVEDDASLAQLVCEYLEQQGFRVTLEADGAKAIETIQNADPDLVLLDIMLPNKNGLDICRDLRTESNVPVIILTAQSDDIDQIVGLEVGADDYICKPVQPRLLLARIKSLLRRTNDDTSASVHADAVIQVGGLLVNATKQKVTLNEAPIALTTTEMALLHYLAANKDKVLSRDDLMNQIRGFDYDGIDRTVDMLVSRIRKKLEPNPASPERIKTVWKRGYLFVSDAW